MEKSWTRECLVICVHTTQICSALKKSNSLWNIFIRSSTLAVVCWMTTKDISLFLTSDHKCPAQRRGPGLDVTKFSRLDRNIFKGKFSLLPIIIGKWRKSWLHNSHALSQHFSTLIHSLSLSSFESITKKFH